MRNCLFYLPIFIMFLLFQQLLLDKLTKKLELSCSLTNCIHKLKLNPMWVGWTTVQAMWHFVHSWREKKSLRTWGFLFLMGSKRPKSKPQYIIFLNPVAENGWTTCNRAVQPIFHKIAHFYVKRGYMSCAPKVSGLKMFHIDQS